MTYFRKEFSTGYIDPHDHLPNLTPSQSSLMVSILSAGTFFGALGAAPIGDKLGRRPSLIIAIVVFAFGVSLQTASTDIPLFVSGRSVTICNEAWKVLTYFVDSWLVLVWE